MLTVGDRNDAMDETTPETWLALSSALGLGLLIGLVRERRPGRAHAIAGLRTHALVALAAAVAMSLGVPVLLVALALTGLLAAMGYRATSADDPGLTSEVTLVLTFLLGAMAMRTPALATGLAVVVAMPTIRCRRTGVSLFPRPRATGVMAEVAAGPCSPIREVWGRRRRPTVTIITGVGAAARSRSSAWACSAPASGLSRWQLWHSKWGIACTLLGIAW